MSAAAAVLPGVVRSPIGCTAEEPSPKAFTEWCAKRAVLWPKCGVAVSAATGRCVAATQDIQQGEVVVEVPDDAVLMGENCQIQELLAVDGLLKPAEDALLEVQGLILGVMCEKALGQASAWGPYLAFLPDDMSHMPMYWTESELDALRGTAAHDKMLGRVQHPADAPTRVSQLFEELVLPFVQSHEQVCKVLLGGRGPVELTEEAARQQLWPAYCWATAAVASYSFVLGDDHYQGMVPVWDLLNHISGAANVRLHHDHQRGVLQMIATQDIPKGAEVVNCYGQLSNAELLRGYGYVECHNSTRYVQVPAQFLIRVAAGAAAGAEGAAAADGFAEQQQGQKAAGNARAAEAAASKPQRGAVAEAAQLRTDGEPSLQPEDEEAGGRSSGSESGCDAESADEGEPSDYAEHSSDDDEEEPDWELEDDDEQLQKQQQPPVPPLHAAQQQVSDWEDRWQLCFSLGLLPKNGVFQVPAGGMGALPPQLLPALLLLLADAADCEKLAAAAAAASSKAAGAAAAAAKAAAAAAKGGSKQGKKQTKRQKKQQGDGGGDEAAVEGGSSEAAETAAAGSGAAGPSSSSSASAEELALVEGLRLCSAGRLGSALQLLVRLMQSRYTCSLPDDEARLDQLDQLSPRLAAAVLARIGEKRVLQQLGQALQYAAVEQQLMEQGRQALCSAVQRLAEEAAAAASVPAHSCCGVAGCSHAYHEREHHPKQKTKKQQQQQPGGIGIAGKRRGREQQAEEEEEEEEEQQAGGGKVTSQGCQTKKAAASKGATAAEAGPGSGFAFNFQV